VGTIKGSRSSLGAKQPRRKPLSGYPPLLGGVTQARAAASAAGANLLPTADLNAQAAAMRQSLDSPIGQIAKSFPGYSRDQRLYDVGAQASWEIDLFGGSRRAAQAARAEAQAAEAERLGTRISVSADSADAYLQVRGDQARLTVAEKQVDVDSKPQYVPFGRSGADGRASPCHTYPTIRDS
jgi:hypothetical protein